MAVKAIAPAPAGKDTPPAAATPAGSAAKPGSGLATLMPWLGLVFVASLVLVFCGERIVSGYDWARYGLSGIGLLGAIASTALRLAGAGPAVTEQRKVERALVLFQAIGLLALAVYFATTDTGKSLLGIAAAAPDTRARIEGALTVGWIVLIVGSLVPLLFGEGALAPMRRALRMEIRRVHAATIGGLTLAFAVIYACLFTYAAGELDQKVDFSYFRTARPSESTRKIAASLTEPVKVMAFFPQLNDVGIEVDGYLRDLAKASTQIQIETYDRLLVPAIAKDAKVTQDGVIVLLRGPTREVLTVGSEMKSAASKLKSLDADFQKSLLKSMRDQRTAYLTVGHGEISEGTAALAAQGRAAKGFRKLLESQNYSVRDLGIAQGLGTEIPKDAYLVAILGPAEPFLPEEIAALRRYAERGGKILMALDPDGDGGPGADIAGGAAKVDHNPLADIADVTWQPTVLASADGKFIPRRRNNSDKVNLFTNKFSSHASVSTLSRNSAREVAIFPGAAALDKKNGSTAKVDFAVRTMGDTFPDMNGNFELDQATEKKTTQNLVAAVTKPATAASGDKPEEMRAFVVGDVDALSDALLGDSLPLRGWVPNIVLVLDALRWLGGEESFAGEIAVTEDVLIEHTKQKDVLWFYATIFAAPALVLGIGFITTRRTRRSGRRA